MEFGVNILRKGGKLVMVGLYGGACPISTVLFPFKVMTIEGSLCGHARGSEGASRSRSGWQSSADPD
jgi:threonine dehydrogenase-like Zn-dependent dehydrogenase